MPERRSSETPSSHSSDDAPRTAGDTSVHVSDCAPVRLCEAIDDQGVVCWDAARRHTLPDAGFFDVAAWRAAGRVSHEAVGRGTAWFLRSPDEDAWVLRRYRRGGMIARVNRDLYAWIGASATRPIREMRILADLFNRGLAVPRPVAARAVRRFGIAYSAELVTEAIVDARPLADRLFIARLAPADWQALGRSIAAFHAIGLWHADLNARNVLHTPDGRFHLIDFDRARLLTPHRRWRAANLSRLRRSLDKFAARRSVFHFTEADWSALVMAYRDTLADAPVRL